MTIQIPEEVKKVVAQAIRDADDGEQSIYDIATAAIAAAIESGLVVRVSGGEAGWQPIETAPNDDYLIGWHEEWGEPHEVYNLFGNWHFDDDKVCNPFPTHWLPMPTAPHSKIEVDKPTQQGE